MAAGGCGQGLRCLGGFKFSSFSHFFSQALIWKARLLVPNLSIIWLTLGRRCSRQGLQVYSSSMF